MGEPGWALFPTAIGACGLAWGPRGITGAQLPETDEAATRARLQQRFGAAAEAVPPPAAAALVGELQALLRGEPRHLDGRQIDWTGVPEFAQRVYRLTLAIPPGQTRTYGEIARALGLPGAARAVGRALGANPFAPLVPCHRVRAAAGGLGGFSAAGGAQAKQALLLIEGAGGDGQPQLF